MDEPTSQRATKERIVNWSRLRRGAKRPMPWLALGAVAIIGFLLLEAYVFVPGTPAPEQRGFRFDAVYMLERNTDGNTSTFAVSPWFSNEGGERLRELQFVVYAIENNRRIATAVVSSSIGDLASRTTHNTTLEFALNNTRDYSIEILVLEGDYLIARGYGSVGWIRYYDLMLGDQLVTRAYSEPSMYKLQGGSFDFQYPGN